MMNTEQITAGNGEHGPDITGSEASTFSNILRSAKWQDTSLMVSVQSFVADSFDVLIESSSDRNIPMESLYPVTEQDVALPIAKAMTLLKDCIGNAESALEFINLDDIHSADDAMIRLKSKLPELFCLRTLGDGYGGVINAIQNAYVNLNGNPFSRKQINVILQTLIDLRKAPGMSFDTALGYVEKLERSGLNIDEPFFEYVVELLDV